MTERLTDVQLKETDQERGWRITSYVECFLLGKIKMWPAKIILYIYIYIIY